MTTDSLAERVARIEATIEHLATKADLERQTVRIYVALTVATGIILAAMRLWT
jgi:response regulator of citrate/malate metabolism